MKASIKTMAAIAAAALFVPLSVSTALPASAAITVTSHFIWTNTSTNSFYTLINNAATNGEPNALLFVTPTYDPGGVCGCAIESAPVAAIWAGGANQWGIITQDVSNIPVGAAFNVLVVQKASSHVFAVTATSQNTSANGMTISKTAINGNSNALLQVTQSIPKGLGGVFNPHPIGVVYGLGASGNLWDIQNVDNAAMPLGATFNVMVGGNPSNGGKAVLLKGTSTNTVGTDTFVSNAQTTGNPNAVVFETQNADPGLNFGFGDVAPTGVAYRMSPTDVAAVFNENGASMPTGTHYFNLLIFPS
jgi:hypothetical protein